MTLITVHAARQPRRTLGFSSGAILLLLLGTLGLCGTACNETPPADAEDAGAFVRLELTSTTAVEEVSSRVAYSLPITAALEGIRVKPEGFSVEPNPAKPQPAVTLILPGTQKTQAIFRGVFDPRLFNQVVLRYQADGTQNLAIALHRKGEQVYLSSAQKLYRMERPEFLVFDLPAELSTEEPVDQVRIILRSNRSTGQLSGVDLLSRASRTPLPTTSAPALVEIGLESRLAVGLSSANPLQAASILPPNPSLSFGYGQPQGLGPENPGPALLRVTVVQDSFDLKLEYPIDFAELHESGWQTVVLPLAGIGDRHASLQFELVTENDEDNLIALELPVVFSPQEDPPTTLLITSDTHRADHLGIAGAHPALKTPFLDGLAERGLYFENAYSSTNITIPSHVALMTATHPRDTEVVNNTTQASMAAETLAECYRAAGYATFSSVSAGHLSHKRSGLGQGFDRSVRPVRMIRDADEAIDSLEHWIPDAEGRPLFVWLHLFDAHGPYEPPGEFDGIYWDESRDPFDETRPAFTLADPIVVEKALPEDLQGLRDIDYPHAQYMAEITYLDDQLGRLLAFPRFAQAQIAMTADHGESFGDHGVWFAHAGLYPQTLHVPLMLAGPGIPVGKRSAKLIGHLDLGRTLLDLSGLAATNFPGRNLLDMVEVAEEEPVFTLSSFGSEAAITFQGFHLVLHLESRISNGLARITTACDTEFYAFASDPDCSDNLWGQPEHEARGTELRARLIVWLKQARPTGWATQGGPQSAADLAELAKLGYAAGPDKAQGASWFENCED